MSALRRLVAIVASAPVALACLCATLPVRADMNTDYNATADSADSADAWRAPPADAQRRNTVRADRVSIRRGAKTYVAHCANCHGAKGAGDGRDAAPLNIRPPNLAIALRDNSDGEIAWKIANGRGAMPAWRGRLKDAQIWDTVNYLRHFVAPRVRSGQTLGQDPGGTPPPSDMDIH